MNTTLNHPTASHTPPRGAAITPAWFAVARRASVAGSTVLVGLAAGFFFTYQVSVTRGLAIVDDANYVSAFQAINATVRTTWFGIVFFGSIPMLVATLALNWSANRAVRSLLAVALLAYLATFGITAIGSVPLNDELALVTVRTPAAFAEARGDYEAAWNRLNLIRTLTCVTALAALAGIGMARRPATR